jgi:O-antigen/teichoic acid export membrane protein
VRVSDFVTGFFARVLIAAFNLLTLLICSRYLGSEVLGEISLLILNIAVIQAINDIYTGPALVYFIPRADLRNLYRNGLFWTVCCILPLSFVFYVFNIGLRTYWIDVLVLAFLVCGTAFHNVMLLGRERIKPYYFLLFLQPALLFAVLALNVFAIHIPGTGAYLLALYISWTVTFCVSLIFFVRELQSAGRGLPQELPRAVLAKGLYNQLGNLAHILSNRYNYYILSAVAAVGVYASATSLIESVWIISAAVAPVLLTHVANRRSEDQQAIFTLRLARACLFTSLLCVAVVILIPHDWFTRLLGKDFTGVKQVMLLLAPGVLAVSFSSIISHYYSGHGRQNVLLAANACGFVVTLALSYLMISRFGLNGAAITASLAYCAQAIFLIIKFRKEADVSIAALLGFKRVRVTR